MGFFDAFKKMASSVTREFKAEYGNNKDFLEAACAASALIAAADGSIDPSEMKETVALLEKHPQLGKLYRSAEIKEVATTMFDRANSMSGRQALARELDDLKGMPNAATMQEDVYFLAADVAAQGGVSPEEEKVLEKLASKLGVQVREEW